MTGGTARVVSGERCLGSQQRGQAELRTAKHHMASARGRSELEMRKWDETGPSMWKVALFQSPEFLEVRLSASPKGYGAPSLPRTATPFPPISKARLDSHTYIHLSPRYPLSLPLEALFTFKMLRPCSLMLG